METEKNMEPHIALIALDVHDLNKSARCQEQGLDLPRRESLDAIAFSETAGAMNCIRNRCRRFADSGPLYEFELECLAPGAAERAPKLARAKRA